MGTRKLVVQDDAAEYIGVRPQTLANWRYLGIGPRYFKLGRGAVRYDLADLDAYLEANAHDPGADREPAA